MYNKIVNGNLKIPKSRTKKYISYEEFCELKGSNDTLQAIIAQTKTSKHLVNFYSLLYNGNFSHICEKEFEGFYNSGKSLEKISEIYNIRRIHAGFLRNLFNIKVKGATFQKRIRNERELADEAKNIIIGSMLGDGMITPSGCYSEKHSNAQLEYLKWKASFFPHIINEKSWYFYENIDKRSGTKIYANCFRTTTHSYFHGVRDKWYDINGTKTIPKDISNYMTPMTFAVWLFDDGNVDWHYRNGVKKHNPTPSIQLCTECFSEDEVDFLIDVLNYNFNFKSYKYKRSENKFRIKFRHFDAYNVLNMCKPFATKDMMYKVDEESFLSEKQYVL
jgi:hypothetical protein